jgi:hypothetical protein
LPTETSNEAQGGISARLSGDISRHGKSEARRAVRVLNIAGPGAKPSSNKVERNKMASRSNDQGLICSSMQPASIALRVLRSVLVETERFCPNHVLGRYG